MKKLMMFVFLILSIPLVAQVVSPPTDWLDLFANVDTWLGSLVGIAAVTVFLTAAVNTLLKVQKGWIKQVVAMIVSLVLLGIGNVINMGFMAELNLWHTIVYGLAGGLLANGIFDITLIRAILRLLKIEPPER